MEEMNLIISSNLSFIVLGITVAVIMIFIITIINNIKQNKILLYTTIFYFVILFVLLFILYYIYSHQKEITGLERVTSPVGSIGVDNPRDA